MWSPLFKFQAVTPMQNFCFTASVVACVARQFWSRAFQLLQLLCKSMQKNLISKQVNPLFVLVSASEQGTGEKRDLQD